MASQSAMECAIQEIKRGEELMNSLHSHLQQQHTPATDLSAGIQRALAAALAILRSKKTNADIDSDARLGKKRPPMDGSGDDRKEKDQKKRKLMNSRTIFTPAPYLDGHGWRKYGQKMIHNSKHPRSYYRCTNRSDQGCLATKLVQEEESCDDSPMFRVTYTNQHTCKATLNLDSTDDQQIIFTSSPPREPNFFVFESQSSYPKVNNVSKQEQLISLRPQSYQNCSSLSMSSASWGSKTSEIEEDTSSISMIKDLPLSPSSWDFYFHDVDSILNSLA